MSSRDFANVTEDELAGHFEELYTLGKKIGGGGNSVVHKAKAIATGDIFAVKMLDEGRQGARARFNNEINSLTFFKSIESKNVIPILDSCNKGEKYQWYLMPLGVTIKQYFKKQKYTAFQKMETILELALAIKSIHGRGYSHRDIKPGNILVVNDRIVLADFGLVWHPDQLSMTRLDERVGPYYTMAPEMARPEPKRELISKADVYSFAKTIWMLLTNNSYSFYGQYSFQSKDFLDYNNFRHEGIHTLYTFNEILYKSTHEDPSKRPTMDEVITNLGDWFRDNSDLEKSRILNEREKIRRGLARFESDRESYIDIEAIRNMLVELSGGKMLSFQRISQMSFNVDRVLNYGEGLLILFDDSQNKRYMVKPRELMITKSGWKTFFETNAIQMESIPDSDSYVFTDASELDFVGNMFIEIDPSGKDEVFVISDSSSFSINIL